jgi:hypothetical protein
VDEAVKFSASSGFCLSISRLILPIKYVFFQVMLGAQAVVTALSFVQGNSSSFVVLHTFKNKSSVVVP